MSRVQDLGGDMGAVGRLKCEGNTVMLDLKGRAASDWELLLSVFFFDSMFWFLQAACTVASLHDVLRICL
jgi:hypothetical protein